VVRDHKGRRRALRWVAHDPAAINLEAMRLESARTLEEALAVAHGAGLPAQNFVVGDAKGGIAWTVAGRIPRRVGFDGRVPTSWADGRRRWDGWLDAREYPAVVNPPGRRIWTANNRVVNGPALGRIGVGNYDLGARAGQIRDQLRAGRRFRETDMLAIQLDDRACSSRAGRSYCSACWRRTPSPPTRLAGHCGRPWPTGAGGPPSIPSAIGSCAASDSWS
jgi:penicillin amidase